MQEIRRGVRTRGWMLENTAVIFCREVSKLQLARVSSYSPWKQWNTVVSCSCSATKGETGKFRQSLSKLNPVKSGFCTDSNTDKSAPKQAQWSTAMTGSFLPALPRQAIPAGRGDNCLTWWDDPQPFGSLCQCFLALNLIILHKANPETRRSVSHQICSKLFSFYSKTG